LAAVKARVRGGWNKFRQRLPLLTNKAYETEIICKLCAWLYVTWQWNMASKERTSWQFSGL